MCTVNSSSRSRAGWSLSFLYFLKFVEMQPSKAKACALHLVQGICTPMCLLCWASLAWTFGHRAQHCPNNYCQNCNGMYLEALWNQKNIQNADRRFDLTVIRKYANNSLQSCKCWNGHDPAALGQSSNLPPFTSFLRWEATKPDSACPSAHLCRLLHNLHQTWLRATREVKRVISHE